MPSRSFWNAPVVILEKKIRGASAASLTRFAGRAQRAAGLRGRVSILVTGSAELRRLNRRYRGKDKATDVLSFPANGVRASRPHPHVAGGVRASRRHLQMAGDIAISAEVAAKNARRFGHSPAAEVEILILHGLLHLAGLDHDDARDRGQMARREEKLRRRLGLPGSLTGRSSAAVGKKS
jgi:probable rRNA maturation factor